MAAQFIAQLLNLLARGFGHPVSYNRYLGKGSIANYSKAALIYNPVSGKLRRHPHFIRRTIEILGDEGISAQPIPTTGPRMAEALARRAVDENVDLILVAGGDGTINEVINGVAPSRIPVGIVPAGTANVLACELGMNTHYKTAARLISQCVPERVALGRLRNAEGEQRYFLLMAGIGLDAEIVYNLSAPLKAWLGKAAYWIGGLSHLLRPISQFDTTVAGRTLHCGFALASRVRNYGGDLEIARGANLLEDDFEIVLFQGRNPVRYMIYFMGVVGRFLPGLRGIELERATKVEFTAPEDSRIYVQVDGEFAGHLPASIEIVPDALSLLVPADFRARTPARVLVASRLPVPTAP
jgi:YegS/Rv2252/BmrU family lipid kinase